MRKIVDKSGEWTGAVAFEGKEQGEVVQALYGRVEELGKAVAAVKAEKRRAEYLAAHAGILASFDESARLCRSRSESRRRAAFDF